MTNINYLEDSKKSHRIFGTLHDLKAYGGV